MLLIPCPWCGEREEAEFHNGGEAHIERPLKPESLSDEEWAEYLFISTGVGAGSTLRGIRRPIPLRPFTSWARNRPKDYRDGTETPHIRRRAY